MSIKIPRAHIAEMITHSLEQDPDECCGFLIGTGDEVTRLQRMENTAEKKRERFTMSIPAVMGIQEEIDSKGEKFIAVYHSHTYMQAHPSSTDVNQVITHGSWAKYHVLISLVEKTRPVVRAFKIHTTGEVDEVFIATDGMAYTTRES